VLADREWSGWARRRVAPLAIGVLSLPVVVATIAGTLYWPGRIFPGFFVLENGLVPTIGLYDWTGMRSQLPFHARVTSVEGSAVHDHAGVYAIVESRAEGTRLAYTLVKGDEQHALTVPSMRFTGRDYWLTVGIFAFCGVIALGLGVFVGIVQPATPAAHAFLLQGSVTGLYALTGTALYHPELRWLTPLHCVVQTVLPATFIHLVLVFPVARRFVQVEPRWLLAPYVLALVLLVWFLMGFYGSPPDPTPFYGSFVYTAVGIAIFMAVPIYSWWEQRVPRVRRQLQVVIPGVVLATAIALFAHVQAVRAGGEFPINLMAITVPLFYGSIAYAIVRHDLFDIDALVKQAVVYGTLTLGITGAYAGSVALATELAPGLVQAAGRYLQIGLVVLAAAVFEPARHRIQQAVDALFFRRRVDYRHTVGELSAALTSLLDLDEIVTRIGRTVTDGFQITAFGVVLWEDDGTRLHVYRPGAERMEQRLGPTLADLRHRLADVPFVHASPVANVAPLTDELLLQPGTAAELILPLVLGGRVVGAFGLGARRSGRPFSQEDVELLSTLAAQSAIAIENARSYRSLQDLNAELEQKVQQRTADLEASLDELKNAQHQLVQAEKMASLGVLVAGVAHEINNPVSFIVNSIVPMKERVGELRTAITQHPELGVGPALADLEEAVALVGEGAVRTAGIVTDLRAFSRLSDGATVATDIHESIEVGLRLLRPRWADRVTVHRQYGSLPPIQASPGQLNQVFMNLLANACDAIAGSGTVWITTEADEQRVRITIRDDGAGIPKEQLSRIFDPFFTTKPQGKGTGLGLSISHGIVAGHGGEIRVTSETGPGTTVTVTLPIAVTLARATLLDSQSTARATSRD
jgi:signal transduction histidine kinase